MRYISKFLFAIVFILAISFVYPSYASAGSIYLSPASKTIGKGQQFTVAVRMNSGGDAVNAVTANLSYPSDKLDYVGVSSGGSAFGIEAPSSGGGGSISLNRGNINPVSGDKLIGYATFRARVDTGSATVSIAGGSALVRASDQANVYNGGSGTTLTFSNAPAPTAKPSENTEENLVISDVNITDISFNSATVTWKTSIPSQSIVNYGLTDKYGVTKSSDSLATNHSITLDSAILVPGTTYHFQVIGKSSDNGSETKGEDNTFTTRGFTAVLSVKDEQGNPIANADITVSTANGPVSAKTNSNGVATFENLPSGKQIVVVRTENGTQSSTIDVAENIPTDGGLLPTPQQFQIQVAAAKTQSMANPLLLAVIILPALVGLIALILLIRSYRKSLY